MLIIRTKRINLGGIALFPVIIINSKLTEERQKILINHELIHIRQQVELMVIPFYIVYLFNYLLNRFKYKTHNEAYRNIIFEREAFKEELNFEYLSTRPFWNFLKY
jgi:uncharacterized membrane protein YiaA